MIEVKNLVKEFNQNNNSFKAINNVSFKVEQGEIYGIIGMSGAGKSTLVRCINRLEEPSKGSILIDNRDILKLSKKDLLNQRKEIGMIFQSFNLFNQKTVFENISYPLEIINTPKEEIISRVTELLEFIDLVEKKDSYPTELSGGQKQRVAIARAIATKPKILLSDEGTSALDPTNTKSIIALLKKVVEKYQTTIIMITHQMEVAKDICDRIAVMESGKIIEENTVTELFKNPQQELTKSFISSLQDNTKEEVLNAKEFKGTLVRLAYDNNSYKAAILSQTIKNFNVDISIVSGNINKLSSGNVGYLIVEFIGQDEETNKALKFLKNNNVSVEVL